MTLQPLEPHLDEHDQRIVKQALYGIVDLPAIHSNVFIIHREKDGFNYYIGMHSAENPSPIIQPLKSSKQITQALLALGYLKKTKTEGQFEFTEEAKEWYRRASAPTDQEIQHRLGLYLLTQLQQQGQYIGRQEIDLDVASQELRVSRDQLVTNARTLEYMGYVDSGPADQMSVEDGFIFLTKPKGITWANAGAPPIGPDGTPIVNVTVHITLKQVLDQAERSGLSEEDKNRFEELMIQLASEKKQRRDILTTVKDLLDVTKNTKELWPTVIKFATEYGDDIQRGLQQLPFP